MKDKTPANDQGSGLLFSRGALFAAAVCIVIAVITVYAEARWLAVLMVALVEGPIVAGWVLAGWLAARPILKAITGSLSVTDDSPLATSPALKFATGAALGLGLIGLCALGLALAGVLNRWTTLALLFIGPAVHLRHAIAFVRANHQIPVGQWLRRPAGGHWMLLAATPVLGMLITGASITPGLLWKPDDPHPYDVMEYHLQVPREWYEMGRMTGLKHNVYSYFPFGVEIHYLMAMHLRGGPWAAMYQCQFLSIAWLGLTAAGVYGALDGRTRMAAGKTDSRVESRPTGILCSDTPDDVHMPAAGGSSQLLPCAAAVFVAGVPWSIMLGAVAYTEGALAMYTCLAVAWSARASNRVAAERVQSSAPLRAMIVAGSLAGLACGVKYTAVPMVLMAIPAALIVFALIMRHLRAFWKPALAFVIVGGAFAAPWFLRNLAWTGNPVFPLALRQLGPGHFDAVQVERFERAHAAPPVVRTWGDRMGQIGRQILTNWQFGYLLWPLALVATALSWRSRTTWILMGVLLLGLLVWTGFTHLLGRFYVLMIPVAAMLIGQARWRYWGTIASGAAVVAVLIGIGQVHPRLQESGVRHARNGLFGLEDISILTPLQLAGIRNPTTTVWMVGDAQPFLYRVPTARLKYRTVFDLPGDATTMDRAWLGRPINEVDGIIVIQPTEVQRLSQTYYRVPSLPADYPYSREMPEVISR